MREGLLLSLTCVLCLLGAQAFSQEKDQPETLDKENAKLEKWVKNLRGLTVTMKAITFGDIKIKGLKEIYTSGPIEIGKSEWEIRRYSIPAYGDYLDLNKYGKDGKPQQVTRIVCPKGGIREVDVSALLKKLPK